MTNDASVYSTAAQALPPFSSVATREGSLSPGLYDADVDDAAGSAVRLGLERHGARALKATNSGQAS